ncbi:MAG: lamin tail domain-containing protein [Chitinophagaceae bacterium]|nr:lamin tail domain-containing protein [Chitinophagaceae bacterium]
MKKIITFLFLIASLQSFSQSTTLVISQVYGAGGNAGALYNADYVELHNLSAAPVSLSGYSIQYASATNTTTWTGVSALPAVSIPAGGYYLIQMSTVGANGAALPTPDNVASPTIAMSATAGKVALVNNITALVGCPAVGGYVDLVGFGTTANCSEGGTPTPAPSATLAVFRGNSGCTDTDNNGADFTAAAPAPRNGATPVFLCGGGSPNLSATTLTTFGNVCLNATAGPNAFTITGTNLNNTNVTVGALAGFTYSTTAGGTYTTTLSLTQPGGGYSQQIFVKFTPTLVQSYNGNIPVGGGGASSINVAATGSGVNSVPSLTTGAASAITINSATCAGTITSLGCSAVTAYGIEYSTTNGFPNGTGTPVASGNLAGGNFSSNLSGLSSNTVYYYHAYATNGAGTGYGTQQQFTTLNPTLSATVLAGFGAVCINTNAGPNNFTLTGSNLSGNITVASLTGFTFSTAIGGPFTTTLTLTPSSGSINQVVYVLFSPVLVQSYNGNINISGGGASAINVAATGSGVNSIPTLTTGAASAITTNSATCAGTITSTGCSAITAYGIEYSTSAGFPNGTGTPVASGNLAGGNFSSNLAGLSPNTTYYYHSYATNGGGTGYGSEQFFTTQALTPTLSATGLTAFGNVCINTTAGPNSFTINGSALTNANVNVAALTGFTYSTTSGGTYTTTLSLAQGGGTFSQQIFVKFTPTLVQSYNGNIVISGGGAPASVNVAASGSGINTIATVTTGAASAITSISATCAGSIPSIGCSAITAYGIEYSTTNGFPNGGGTPVASGNLAGGNFSSNLTGLAPTTTYYYHAYATNNGGTAYGAQQQFTTATPGMSANALAAFGAVCVNTTAGPNSFTITGTNLTAANINVGPLAGYTFSTTSGGTYTASLSLAQPSGAYSQQIFVNFTPTAVQSYNGNIPVSGGGAAAINVAASGSGVNTIATVTSGAASAITQTTATVAGSIGATGCSAVTAYGIEYSLINNFPNGTGTPVASSNLSGGNFSSNLAGLTPSTTYYYHAYATNGGGTAYGALRSFTTAARC